MSLPVGSKRFSLTYDENGVISPSVHLKKMIPYESIDELARIADIIGNTQYDHVIFVGNVDPEHYIIDNEGSEVFGYLLSPNPSVKDAYLTALSRYGTPSPTNRIAIIILSSVIIETSTIGLRSKYIDIFGVGSSCIKNTTSGSNVFYICGEVDGAKIKGIKIISTDASILNAEDNKVTGSLYFEDCDFYSEGNKLAPQFIVGNFNTFCLEFDRCEFYPSDEIFRLKNEGEAIKDFVIKRSFLDIPDYSTTVKITNDASFLLYDCEIRNNDDSVFTDSVKVGNTSVKIEMNNVYFTEEGSVYLVGSDGGIGITNVKLNLNNINSNGDVIVDCTTFRQFNPTSITGDITNLRTKGWLQIMQSPHNVNVLRDLRIDNVNGSLKIYGANIDTSVRISNVCFPKPIYPTMANFCMLHTTGVAAPTLINCNIYCYIYGPLKAEGDDHESDANYGGCFAGKVYGGSSAGIRRCVSLANPTRQCIIKNHTFYKAESFLNSEDGSPTWIQYPDITIAGDKINDFENPDLTVPSNVPILVEGCTSDGIILSEVGELVAHRYVLVSNCVFHLREGYNNAIFPGVSTGEKVRLSCVTMVGVYSYGAEYVDISRSFSYSDVIDTRW